MNRFIRAFFNFARCPIGGQIIEPISQPGGSSSGGKLDESTERSLINSFRQVQLLLPQPTLIFESPSPLKGRLAVGSHSNMMGRASSYRSSNTKQGVRQLAQETSRPRRMKPMAEVRSSQRQRNGPGQRFPDMTLHATKALMPSMATAALRSFPA